MRHVVTLLAAGLVSINVVLALTVFAGQHEQMEKGKVTMEGGKKGADLPSFDKVKELPEGRKRGGREDDSATKERVIAAYQYDLRQYLSSIPAGQMSAERKQQIVEASATFIDWDGLIKDASLTDADLSGLDQETHLYGLKLKLPKLPGKKELCVIKTIAIAGAIIAAWVASGGTLAIGTVGAGGVVIDSAIYQALVGGASAATIAKIICG